MLGATLQIICFCITTRALNWISSLKVEPITSRSWTGNFHFWPNSTWTAHFTIINDLGEYLLSCSEGIVGRGLGTHRPTRYPTDQIYAYLSVGPFETPSTRWRTMALTAVAGNYRCQVLTLIYAITHPRAIPLFILCCHTILHKQVSIHRCIQWCVLIILSRPDDNNDHTN